MKSEDAFESITLLKNKFEEIKNNILSIEREKIKKYEEFQGYKQITTKFVNTRPSSASKIRPSHTEDFSSPLFQSDSSKIESLKAEIRLLQEQNRFQSSEIQSLRKENFELRERLNEKVLNEKNVDKRPTSCLRTATSPPKKARVVFAKELTSVKLIPRAKSEDFGEWLEETENEEKRGEEFDTPPRTRTGQRSLRGYLNEKRAEMNKLKEREFDIQGSGYFGEQSLRIVQKILND
jgi:hypothetical protein